ncbi:unnamed protein product [Malus baccata var. baccata]
MLHDLQQLFLPMALSTQRASASFLLNESTHPSEYDVFLSFRGVDTRKGFVSHLYHELWKCQGITTFIDNRELEGGTSIRLELPSAIKKSHTAIVVLSPNYASSKWCLDELTTILQCMEARKSVLPVFYETDPSDIGNQRGSFAEALEEHERNLISTEDKKKVIQWKADLNRVSKISGRHWKDFKCDRELIEDIVKWVWRKVQPTFPLSVSSRKLVGIDYALEQLSLLLAHDVNDVRFIGIMGMGGIGKTTLANLVYDKICHDFEVHWFLVNVREVFAKNGIVDLAKKLLFPFLRERIAEIWDEERVSILIEKFLHNKKVLLVLDDVDELKQLELLAGNQGWFGMGSRIIVTTRNQRLLVQHGIETSYKVQGLNDAEALKLFSLHAFKKDQPEEDFLELSKYFINYASGLPLALIIFGSALFKRGLDAWISERDSLSKILNPTIFDKLKISYDRLDEREKSIFLDVACFHIGKYTKKVTEILYNSNPFGMSSRIVIDVLIERSLLYQYHHNCIRMHDLIQEMAWKIVGDESKESGQRSRLWLFEDINHVFMTNTGTEAIEAISLCLPKIEEVHQWNWEAFSKLHGLRFLEFGNLIFTSSPEFLPCSLRTINWSFYPSKFLPTRFQPHFLTQLEMRGSKLVRLWEGKKDLPNLKYIDLSDSNKLISTPDFSGLSKLETLDLASCKNLVEIHPSLAVLKKLKSLWLCGCKSIKNLPSKVEMDSLEIFDLSDCSNLKEIPEFGEQMKNVSWIFLGGTAIEEIPSSIGHLVGLKKLNLMNCKNLLNLPMAIYSLKSLEHLEFDKLDEGSDAKARDGCGLLRCLGLERSRPDPPRWGVVSSSLNRLCSLRELYLRDCELYEGDIPDDIGCLSFLERLDLSGNNFVSLPKSIRSLSKLSILSLRRCKSLQELPPLPSKGSLWVDVENCTSLKRLLDPSKMMSRYTSIDGRESFCYKFFCLNNIALAQDEGWINTILSTILKFATQGFSVCGQEIVIPGSEIPGWFKNQSVGHSVNVELPPPSCTDWLGIAFCVVFEDPKKNLANPAALPHCDKFNILVRDFYSYNVTYKIGSLMSEHLWVFYLDRCSCYQEQFLFETYFDAFGKRGVKADLNTVKKCGARLLYKQDLEELNQTLKILK